MATFTITTPVNIDSLSGKTGGDVYNINGGYLTIDQDSRYGTNQSTSSSWGIMTLSATLGGTVEVNSTLVRLIAYDTGTGNVPAIGTTISQGGASGILLGVYDTLASEPTTAGSAMPADGYIKIRQWNSVAYTTGALTGIGANATAADRAGWLELVGDEASVCIANRLGLLKMQGDYFELGTTDGTRATTYQIPSHNTLQYHGGVEVETGSGTGVYEFYPCAGTKTALLASFATDEVRGKICWISSAGLLRFGHDGTNSTGGYCPAAGRKIRMYNIFLANCTTAARTANSVPHATMASRYEFATTGGGVLEFDKVSCAWYMNLLQPFSLDITNVVTLDSLVISEVVLPIAFDKVHVGMSQAGEYPTFSGTTLLAGGTISNCVWAHASVASSGGVCLFTDCNDFTLSNIHTKILTRAAATTAYAFILTRTNNFTFNDTIVGGARIVLGATISTYINNTIYYDRPSGNTTSTIPFYLIDMASLCIDTYIDGLSFGGLNLVQPYRGILQIGPAGSINTVLRNLGTYASPLDLGGAYIENASWSRTTTVLTITSVAHGLEVADVIALNIMSDTSVNAVTTTTATLEAVATVPTADTFTITVSNAGTTSGTCSYYPCMTGTVANSQNGAVANGLTIQRVYTQHTRGTIIASDNSSKNIQLDSVFGTDWGAPLFAGLNCNTRMCMHTAALTAQTSCYGTHFLDYYTTGIPTNTAGVSWTRATTTATITSTGHKMRTGDLINVTVTSDTGAIVLGQKTITATTSNAFTFTCLNAGGASGTLTFVPLHGRFAVLMNEPTAETSAQVTLANGAAFTSAGGLYMPVIGHSAIFETPYYMLGHLNFPIAQAVMAGGTIANYHTQYDIDTGSGFSTYKNLHYPRTGAGGTNGSTNVTMTSTTGVEVGDYVFGTNIGPNAKVTSITNGTTVVVDNANIGTVSGTLIFNHLPSESDIPSTGAKVRVKITTVTTNSTAITSLYFFMQSNDTTRAYQYPLDVITLSLEGLVSGSDVVIRTSGTETVLDSADSVSTYSYTYETPSTVDIAVYKAGYIPWFLNGNVLGLVDGSVQVSQFIDRAYLV